MSNLTISQLASVSDLQRDYRSLVERIKKVAQPIVLLRRNKPEAVLISVAAYEELVEKKRLCEEGLALEAVADFEKERKAGRLLIAKKPEDLFRKTE